MSVESVIARMSQLQAAFAPAPPPVVAPASAPTATAASATQFAGMLNRASLASSVAGVTAGGGGPAQQMLRLAEGEIGQAEQPPGSNDSPRIAEYRSATEGAPGPGPWCAYFVSWAARNAGIPLGDHGQGFGSVDAVYAWAQSAGRANPAGSGTPPRPGDLIVWDEHIGIVQSVDPDGTIHTIEGNSSDRVSQRAYGPDGGGAIGFVRMS